MRLIGTVERGVEQGCIVLLDDNKNVLANLIGAPSTEYRFGSKAEVAGRFVKGLMTTCQQGSPFQVTEITWP